MKFYRFNQQKRNYRRITYEKRQELIYQITKLGKTCKEAAKIVKLNYPAAKSLMAQYKVKKYTKKPLQLSNQQAEYRKIKNGEIIKFELITQIYGDIMSQQTYIIIRNDLK